LGWPYQAQHQHSSPTPPITIFNILRIFNTDVGLDEASPTYRVLVARTRMKEFENE